MGMFPSSPSSSVESKLSASNEHLSARSSLNSVKFQGRYSLPSWQLLDLINTTDADWGIMKEKPDRYWKYKFSVMLMFFLLVLSFSHLHFKLPPSRGFLCAWLVTASSCQNKPTYIFIVIISECPEILSDFFRLSSSSLLIFFPSSCW